MSDLVLTFAQIDRDSLPMVGGKGANLGELSRAGFPVPDGFCVTTQGYRAFVAPAEAEIGRLLAGLDPADLPALRLAGESVRARLGQLDLREDLVAEVRSAWAGAGTEQAYAVRSSATAEDLPGASFAGQQDTYLNVVGIDALLGRIKACLISLYTDRAILYRIQNGFAHEQVALSVVVQHMVSPELSGILFTADPISESRHILSIDASFGLGEALVSGLVSADLYKVDKRSRAITETEIARKTLAIQPVDGGGTRTVDLDDAQQTRPALTPEQVLDLADIGARIEAHYGTPQDIEWAIAQGRVFITQSRPITSLYPAPRVTDPQGALHIFLCLSHLQVMTDAMPPLSLSLWRFFPPVGLAEDGGTRFMQDIGGRPYADLSPILRHPLGRRIVTNFLGVADELTQASVRAVVERPEFLAKGPRYSPFSLLRLIRRYARRVPLALFFARPTPVTNQALQAMDAYVAEVRQALLDPSADHVVRLERGLAALSGVLPVAGEWVPKMAAAIIAQRLLHRVAGAQNAGLVADLERGVEGNVVTDMNLAIGDLADLARDDPAALSALAAGKRPCGDTDFVRALDAFMATYGARGPSEIDPSRPRWHEDPASLLQMIHGMTGHAEAGTHRRHYRGLIDAAGVAAIELPRRVGLMRRPLVRRLIRVSRAHMPLREHHKLLMIRTVDVLKSLILEIADDLARRRIIAQPDDIWFLTVADLRDALSGRVDDLRVQVTERRAAFGQHARKAPPRVITSDGEIPRVSLSIDGAPQGALLGSPVSAGVYEGVAHVVLDPGREILKPGEILVAPFTDPGWTPLFVNAGALVTEVGGLMTHGSVVAREYGIPAVVGLADATRTIKTGDRLRINGDLGFVQILTEDNA